MQSALYVSLSGQVALQRRIDTISHNVANSGTAGFRAEAVKFEALLSPSTTDPVAFASTGATYLSRRAGELVKTGAPLDVAVEGDAWLAIETPAGQVYTRDGRMRMNGNGELETLNGYPVLDVGGAPLQLDPNAGEVQISRDGTVTQNGRQAGALGLFTIASDTKLSRFENSGVIPEQPAEPALDFSQVGIVQGFMERANVNPVQEVSSLILVSRTFDALAASLNQTDSTLRDAIQTLGPSR